MTIAELTPGTLAVLGCIAVGLCAMWSLALWLRKARKVDKENEAGESPKDW